MGPSAVRSQHAVGFVLRRDADEATARLRSVPARQHTAKRLPGWALTRAALGVNAEAKRFGKASGQHGVNPCSAAGLLVEPHRPLLSICLADPHWRYS